MKLKEYFEEINANKYLGLVPTDKTKKNNGRYEELWIEIRDIIRLKAGISGGYDGKYMKIPFNSDE